MITFDDDDNATSAGLMPSVPKVTCNPAAEGVVLQVCLTLSIQFSVHPSSIFDSNSFWRRIETNVYSLPQFLQQYFKLYDGDNREQLMEAYHEDAVMSMSIAYPPNVSAHGSQR